MTEKAVTIFTCGIKVLKLQEGGCLNAKTKISPSGADKGTWFLGNFNKVIMLLTII